MQENFFLGQKMAKKGVKKDLLTDILVDKAYLVTESLIKLNLIVIERFFYSKFEVNNYIVNFTSIIDFNSIY